MLVIVGRIITVKIRDAARILNPVPPNCSLINGTIIIIPKNPYTTEGIPAKACIVGFKVILIPRGAISAKNMAQDRDRGIAMSKASPVMYRDPTIIGKAPKMPLKGSHSVPNIKLKNPTLLIAGRPFVKINPIIKRVMILDDIAAINNNLSTKISSNFLCI